uniref:Vesicle-fusing ATPase n=1 Tax=Tetraselmis chuii TaxID=63592 RepID=A0A7S1WY84_9CHLO|mmetsp:Transcript_12222/g.21942  ORF Transcript_12222/g.21942 Transcript_12222/m.21942 type:complete len:365 (+) Transcript_12222:459-1553(+)
MSVDFKGKGIEFVNSAVQEDEAENYEKAYELYVKAFGYFQAYLKHDKTEKNQSLREIIRAKYMEYMTRAEAIKQMLDSVDSTANSQAKATGATATKAKPKGHDDNEDSDLEKVRGSLGGLILEEKPDVKWDDVAGLEGAKEALNKAVILPIQFPQFFTGARKPWSGILLYGPPGTGKSYLAKAIATEADSTFFAVSSSDLVSTWMGDSEKLVSQLFALARERAPSIVFIDEIDSLCSARGDSGESEAARHIKTEFLVQMQGVGKGDKRVLVLGATNMPHNLDQAVRRRFDKRIYIPLPEAPARSAMLKIHLKDTPHNLRKEDFDMLGAKLEGFSGSDCAALVRHCPASSQITPIPQFCLSSRTP